MGGLFAIAAAGIAYLGIKETVKRTDIANENAIAARIAAEGKAAQEQWWSVLQWAYEQASKDGPSASTFKDKAVVGIFQSLAVPGLSDVQQGALDQITTVFEEKQDPTTTTEISALREAVNASAESSQLRSHYRSMLGYDLTQTNWTGMKTAFSNKPNSPVLFHTKKGSLVAVVPLVVNLLGEEAVDDARIKMRQLADEWLGRTLTVSDKPKSLAREDSWREESISKVLIVTNAPGHWPSDEGDDPLWAHYTPPTKMRPRGLDNPATDDRLISLRKAISSLACH